MDNELTEHSHTRQKGAEFESMAAHFLMEQGAQIIARNFQCRCGELDLVALIDGTVAFVEVRFRISNDYGDPLESITRQKQSKLKKASLAFFQRNPHWETWPCRFDVIAIYPHAAPKNDKPPASTHRALPLQPSAHAGRHRGLNLANHYRIEWVCDAFQVDAW